MAKALGMIETKGIVGSIEAADAMVKASNVSLVKQEKVDAALVTVLVQGDVSAVQAAVETGKEAAEKVGELIGHHVIPNPDDETNELLSKEEKTKQMTKKQSTKQKTPEHSEEDSSPKEESTQKTTSKRRQTSSNTRQKSNSNS